jgi:hypothetical protein
MQHAVGQPRLSEHPRDRKPPLTGVRTSGLSTTALPSASAGATERIDRISGTLNGEITPTTPTGTLRSSDSRGWLVGRICPGGWEASAAAS